MQKMKSSTSTKNAASSSDGTCPYAVALEETASVQSNETLEEAIHKCPAFANDASCPFKDATSPAAVQAKMLSIPPSHYQMAAFTKVLTKLHDAKNNNDASSNFHLPGGCPVPAEIKNQMSFRQAMEDLSLAAVMARMAEQHPGASDSEDEDGMALEEDTAPAHRSSTTKDDASKKEAPLPASAATQSARMSLSESLKTGTAASHQAAEDVHFVRNFIRGEIDKGLYAKLVVALYHVYERLETHLDAHGPEHFPTCHFSEELRRTDTLAEDMDFWNGTCDVPPSPATMDYMQRLDEIAKTNPLLLLAHAYTRYLGDLSGGKVLARVAARALHLDRHTMEGLAFYQFEKIPSAKRFKDAYRQALDDLPLTSTQIEGLVAEANVAFCLNMRLFEELDVYANVPDAKVRPLSESLAYANPHFWKEKQQAAAGAEECPFLAQSKQGGSAAIPKKGGRCPWPFILAHDPAQFLHDWQTWVLVGVILCVLWSQVVQASA